MPKDLRGFVWSTQAPLGSNAEVEQKIMQFEVIGNPARLGELDVSTVDREMSIGGHPLARLARLYRPDAIRPHHFIVLVLHDVAMPDKLAGRAELCPHASHLAGIRNHRIFEPRLPGLRRCRYRIRVDANLLLVLENHDVLAIDHLEDHLVDVDGMRVSRDVIQFPYLRHTSRRVLGYGDPPFELIPRADFAVPIDRTELGLDWSVGDEPRRLFDQRETSSEGRLRQWGKRRQNEVLRGRRRVRQPRLVRLATAGSGLLSPDPRPRNRFQERRHRMARRVRGCRECNRRAARG